MTTEKVGQTLCRSVTGVRVQRYKQPNTDGTRSTKTPRCQWYDWTLVCARRVEPSVGQTKWQRNESGKRRRLALGVLVVEPQRFQSLPPPRPPLRRRRHGYGYHHSTTAIVTATTMPLPPSSPSPLPHRRCRLLQDYHPTAATTTSRRRRRYSEDRRRTATLPRPLQQTPSPHYHPADAAIANIVAAPPTHRHRYRQHRRRTTTPPSPTSQHHYHTAAAIAAVTDNIAAAVSHHVAPTPPPLRPLRPASTAIRRAHMLEGETNNVTFFVHTNNICKRKKIYIETGYGAIASKPVILSFVFIAAVCVRA